MIEKINEGKSMVCGSLKQVEFKSDLMNKYPHPVLTLKCNLADPIKTLIDINNPANEL